MYLSPIQMKSELPRLQMYHSGVRLVTILMLGAMFLAVSGLALLAG